MLEKTEPTSLYEADFAEWIAEQIAAIREHRWGDVDAENVAEELESLGRRDHKQLRSRLQVLIMHLLKVIYQPERVSSSWHTTIELQTEQIQELLEDSPSLRVKLVPYAERVYASARKSAAQETGLPVDTFAQDIPADLLQAVQQIVDASPFGDFTGIVERLARKPDA